MGRCAASLLIDVKLHILSKCIEQGAQLGQLRSRFAWRYAT